jgi:hypothetical protein
VTRLTRGAQTTNLATFSRQVDPSVANSWERLARWFSAEPEAASL